MTTTPTSTVPSQTPADSDVGAMETMLSGRQAAAVLAETGVSRASARRALLAGVAGRGLRLRGSVVYDATRVRSLVCPPMGPTELLDAVRASCFIGRIGEGVLPTDEVQDAGQRPGQRESGCSEAVRQAAGPGWRMSTVTRFLHTTLISRGRPMSFVGLVGGFIVAGGEITEIRVGHSRDGAKQTADLTIEAPRPWFDRIVGVRLDLPFGGSWTTLDPARR